MTNNKSANPHQALPSLPSNGPNSWHLREILAYVLVEWELTNPSPAKIPRRKVQRELGRVNGRRVSKALSELVDQKWLYCHRSLEPGHAYSYSPGPALVESPDLFKEWLDYSNGIFGVDGLLAEFRFRASRCYGCLNSSGLIVLASVVRSPGMNTAALVRHLSPVLSRKTVLHYLKRLQSIGLLQKRNGLVEAVVDWQLRLNRFESESMASARKDRVQRTTWLETFRFQQLLHHDFGETYPIIGFFYFTLPTRNRGDAT